MSKKQESEARSQEPEEKQKTPPRGDPKPKLELPYDEWRIKEQDQAEIQEAFESLSARVGLKVVDVMEVSVSPPSHPGKIVFLKHCGPDQKLICDRNPKGK